MKRKIKKFGKWEHYDDWIILFRIKTFLRKRVWTQWLYMSFPFLFTALVIGLMQYDGALFMETEEDFSFLRDSPNSFCMIILFILSYYLAPVYPSLVKGTIEAIREYQNEIKEDGILGKMAKCEHIGIVVSVFGALAGFPFAIVAFQQDVGWMKEISALTRIVYGIYLSMTWYFSLCLLISVLTGCYLIRRIMGSESFHVFGDGYENTKHNLEKVANYISFTVSYAAFWVASAIIIIISDNINCRYHVDLTFHKYPITAIIVVLGVIMGVLYALLPTLEYARVVGEQKERELKKILKLEETEERKRREEQIKAVSSSVFKSGISKITLLVSMIIPVLSLVLQFVSDIMGN